MQFIGFRLMALYGRGSYPISPIYNNNNLMVPKNMCTQFYEDILIVTQVKACMDRRTERRMGVQIITLILTESI